MTFIHLIFCFVTATQALEIPSLSEAITYLIEYNDLRVNTLVLWSENDLSREVFIQQDPSFLPQQKFLLASSNLTFKEHLNGQLVISVDPDIDILPLMNESSEVLADNIFFQVDTTGDLNWEQKIIMNSNIRFDSLIFILSNGKLYEIYKNSKVTISEIFLDNPQQIWVRRSDLDGFKMKAVFATNMPFVYYSKTSKNALEGTNVEIIKTLAKDMNFSLSLYEVADGKFGSYDETRDAWNGVMGDVVKGHADIAIADLTVTESRAKAVKFTDGIFWLQDQLYMKKPSSSFVWTTFLQPFGPLFWLTIGLFYLVLSCFFIISKKSLEGYVDMSTSLVSVGLAIMSLDIKQVSSRLSTRLLIFVICSFGALIWYSYNAALISFLTVVNSKTHWGKNLLFIQNFP